MSLLLSVVGEAGCSSTFVVDPNTRSTPPQACGTLDGPCCDNHACNPGLGCEYPGLFGPYTCRPCGGPGQPCCIDPSRSRCDRDNVCGANAWLTSNSCKPCGSFGDRCCDGVSSPGCVSGGVCSGPLFGEASCHACGTPGQPCCGSATNGSCVGGAVCQGGFFGANECVACGGPGQTCCAGEGCNGTLSCDTHGVCGTCGHDQEVCCANDRCIDGTGCVQTFLIGHTCAHCGHEGEPCCLATPCADETLACNAASVCHRRTCGGPGQACCAGGSCVGLHTCQDGTCSTSVPEGPDAAVDVVDAGDASVAPVSSSTCLPRTCHAPFSVCTPFPTPQCTAACQSDGDCDIDDVCAAGVCQHGCFPGASQCDRYGGACATTLAPATSLDTPRGTATPICVPSCFPADTTAPVNYPTCPGHAPCDPATGRCLTPATPVTIGAPCTADDTCPHCLASVDARGIPTGFVGGYCTTIARNPPPAAFAPGAPLPASNCTPGGVALPSRTSGPGDAVLCYASCATDCDCRTGYACDHDPLHVGGTPSPTGACLPIDCARSGAACPDGHTCHGDGDAGHLTHAVCVLDGADGGTAGYTPGAMNTGCGADTNDGGVDASMDAAIEQ